nr:nuclear transport factor 2 family protein [Maridesulfovibrio sp.]
MGANPDRITKYIALDNYTQHNPAVGDGLAGFGAALKAMADAGTPMIYTNNHMILGEGSFVLSVSEGEFLGKYVSFYDLFRVEDGKIVEHWDTIEEILPRSEWKNANG